jgi:chromosome segregation ATPase
MSRNALAAANGRMIKHIAEMQIALRTIREYNSGLQTQVAEARQSLEDAHAQARRSLEDARAELAKLAQDRDALGTRLSTSAEKIQELEAEYQIACAEADQLKQLLSVHDAIRERDQAKEDAKKAEERIRELTLQLHRSGIWP